MTILCFFHATPVSLHPSSHLLKKPHPTTKPHRSSYTLSTPSPSNHHHTPYHNNSTPPNSHETTPPPPTPPSDHKTLEELTSHGVSFLNAIGEQAKYDLQSVSGSTSAFADSLISDEMDALLKRYDERQRELLDDMDHQRQVIQEEVERISMLVNEGKGAEGPMLGHVPRRVLLYGVNCFLFGVAGFSVMVGGIAKNDLKDIGYAGLLVGVAVVWALLLRREGEKDEVRGNREGENG